MLSGACSGAGPEPIGVTTLPDEPDLPVLIGAAKPVAPLELLNVETYEHSGQSVHPDVLYFPDGWHGWRYWMAYTPYPQASVSYENPSMAVSQDGEHWQAPVGVFNPIVDRPATGYNSDPDISYDAPRDRLVMLYREVTNNYNGSNVVYSRVSSDGVNWSNPLEIQRRPNHGIVSPTMTLAATGKPIIWYVDGGTAFCPERTTRVMMQQGRSINSLTYRFHNPGWSEPVETDLVQPGYVIWHIDVTWVPERNEYWAVYPAYRTGTCLGHELFFARSANGVNWVTYNIPFQVRENGQWTEGTLYRASTLYNAASNTIRIFLSGSDPAINWHLGYVEYKLPEFLSWLKNGTPDPRSYLPPNPLRAFLLRDEP